MTASDNTTPHKANEYDRSVRQTIPFYEVIQSQTLDMVGAVTRDATCWLDTGCGSGYLVGLAVSLFPKTSFVLADPSTSMLEQARARLTGHEHHVRFLPTTTTQNLMAYAHEMHPQVITAVLCHHYLHEPERYRASAVCYDLLEQNGLYVTVENIRPRDQDAISLGLERWRRFQLEQGRPAPVAEDHIKRFNTEYFPITIDEHLELLHEVGFRSAHLFWLSYMQAGFFAIK